MSAWTTGQWIERRLGPPSEGMGSDYIFYMLDDAITLLPEAKLRKLIENYLDATELCSDGTQNLLADAKAFQEASLSGSYYNGAAGHGKNREENPIETLAWIADCRRLFETLHNTGGETQRRRSVPGI